MTSGDTNRPPTAAPGRRHSTGMVIGAAVAGLTLGALAVFALAGITWKIRVELPPPPYPAPFSSTAPASYPSPPPVTTSIAPPTAPSVVPVPPGPPGPR